MIEYDIECYPNIFTFTAHVEGKGFYRFEMSWRVNQHAHLMSFLDHVASRNIPMVGFNNIGYDYPIVHAIYNDQYQFYSDYKNIYKLNDEIINTPWDDRFKHRVPVYQHLTKQIDLYLIHHFDNMNKSTSLKQLEFVMRYENIEDLPYKPGFPIPETDYAADLLLKYNQHDVSATHDFRKYSMDAINFRELMSNKYNHDFTNYNDTKIGKQYFIMQLNNAGVATHQGRDPLQTWRDKIELGKLVFDYVEFDNYEFQNVLEQIKNTVVVETKGALSIQAEIDGFSFDFGLGGIHGSVEGQAIHSDDEYVLIDADVASYYPNLAIQNNVFPEHLSEEFCKVYLDVYNQRKGYKKGTVENAAMKLALNGVYGDSNSKYSPFYDPNYTMTITVNGQLLLCMLAEKLMKIPSLKMVQINTDGLTVKLPRKYVDYYYEVCNWWQALTKLELEYVEYKSMYIRDVNNYIAVDINDKVKYKGAYVSTGAHEGGELPFEKNHSALVVKKAAVAAILHNKPVSEFIRNHANYYDFMMLAKVGRKDSLEFQGPVVWDGEVILDQTTLRGLQRITRYYVSTNGNKLIKKMPPLKRKGKKIKMSYPNWQGKKVSGVNKHLEVETLNDYNNARKAGYRIADGGTYTHTPVREFEVEKGHLTSETNRYTGEALTDINYNYYISQAEKLVNAVIKVK